MLMFIKYNQVTYYGIGSGEIGTAKTNKSKLQNYFFFLGSNSNGQELERTYQEELKRNIELQRTEQLQNTLAHYKSQYVTPKKYDSNADIEPWTLGQN